MIPLLDEGMLRALSEGQAISITGGFIWASLSGCTSDNEATKKLLAWITKDKEEGGGYIKTLVEVVEQYFPQFSDLLAKMILLG
jgi:hypothetical protein